MIIKCSDFKLTQNAASAEPQNWRQIFAEVRPKFGRIVHTLPNRAERSAEFFGRNSAFAELRSISSMEFTGQLAQTHILPSGLCPMYTYRVAPNKLAQFLCTPRLYQILTDFENYFTVRIRRTICPNTITKDPTTTQVCRYTTLWNVKYLRSNNWQQDDALKPPTPQTSGAINETLTFQKSNVHHIEILLPVSILTHSPSSCAFIPIGRWATEFWRHILFPRWQPYFRKLTS